MMRIIETLLLKTQACTKFSARNASHPHTPRLFAPESETSQPQVGRTHIAVHHRMTSHADGTLTAPSPHAHALTSRSPSVERLNCSAVSEQHARKIALTPSVSLSRILSANHHFLLPKTHSTFAYHGVRDVLIFRIDRFRWPSRPNLSRESEQKSRIMPSILLHRPIDSVMSFLSTTYGVVPVDSDQQRS
jgi:hypothetical protein